MIYKPNVFSLLNEINDFTTVLVMADIENMCSRHHGKNLYASHLVLETPMK